MSARGVPVKKKVKKNVGRPGEREYVVSTVSTNT
jgi:hypothetical protein